MTSPAAAAASPSYAIGIDLGTTYSCVGVWKNGQVEIIANDQGNRTTPSYVAFNDTERLIGEAAKNQAASNPSNTIFDAKRLIGRKYHEQTVQTDKQLWPFTVLENTRRQTDDANSEIDGGCLIRVQYRNESHDFQPEQISSMILSKMKSTAETFLGSTVENAVVTVPAYFNDAQRQATKDAGTIAGLNVMRIINEPTAAAIAYGLGKKRGAARSPTAASSSSSSSTSASSPRSESTILIFDLGGGTFDVSLLTIEGGLFEVKSTSGDTHLGGEDFDSKIMLHFVEEFGKKFGEEQKQKIMGNERALRRLRTASERAKRILSNSTQALIELDSLVDGIDFNSSLTRAKFEDLCSEYFQRTLIPLETVLRDGKVSKEEVNEIVLVGGSTRIPKIQNMLSTFFNGKELNKSINPDEAVAYGAAVQAAILMEQKLGNVGGEHTSSVLELTRDFLLLDVTPLSLGIEVNGGLFSKLIPRNTTVPCTKSSMFSTVEENQTSVLVQVYEGERARTKDNNLLGTFEVINIPHAPKGVPQIEVTFELDANGILSVSACEKTATEATSSHITISNNKSRLTSQDIDEMIMISKIFQKEDRAQENFIVAKQSLQAYIDVVRSTLAGATTLAADEKSAVLGYLKEADAWITTNENRISSAATADDDDAQQQQADESLINASTYETKQAELEAKCQPVLKKLFQVDSESDVQGHISSALTDAIQNLQVQRMGKADPTI